jgi:nitroimidazol reductase NimA-like FMN-containing flavoprotein (pyridoxamine 5'-phosphate oxidase superfamily)
VPPSTLLRRSSDHTSRNPTPEAYRRHWWPRLGEKLRRQPHRVCQPVPVQITDDALPVTPRVTLRRKRERGSHQRALINEVLDEALVCHVGFATEHGPIVLPMTFVRIGDDLYLHGAGGNDMLRHLAGGSDLCVTVTLLDGLVLARSAFHHSMNYRCVVLFGRAERVTDPDEMLAASAGLLDHLAPGRSLDARAPSAAELRATLIVRLPISEGSAKVRTGGPIEDPDDLQLPVWAGQIPLALAAQAPIPDAQMADGCEVPAYIARLVPPPSAR